RTSCLERERGRLMNPKAGLANPIADLKPHEVRYTPDEKHEIIRAMTEILDKGWLVLSKYTEQLELEVAEYLGRKHVIAVSSESAALQVALLLANVRDRDVLV